MQKILARLRYPKLFLLCMSALAGFLMYFDQNNFHFHEMIISAGYIGIFFAGFFLAHGFTMGPAIASLFIISQAEPLFPTAFIATIGAIIGNSTFYALLRISYHSELAELSRTPVFIKLQKWANRNTPQFVRAYILPVFAGIISATPLPDEFSVVLVKASKGISATAFTLATAIVGIFGVTIILMLGKLL
jgi:membrane protein YqaA with SNARE-associated domain